MAHSKIKIWIHAIIGVKYREALILSGVELAVHESLRQEFLHCKCPLFALNGTADHVHAQFLLNPDLGIRQVMKQVKGASSHAINQSKLLTHKFAWQVGFGAFSLGESQSKTLSRYIANQKIHHQKITFEQEYQQFIQLYGLADFDDGPAED